MAINPDAPIYPEADTDLLQNGAEAILTVPLPPYSSPDFQVPNDQVQPEVDIDLLPGVPGQRGPTGPKGATGPTGPQGPATDQVDNVLYVSVSGNDNNTGVSLADPFRTIKAAMAVATSGTSVVVKSGVYVEQNPVTIPAGVSLVGDSLRTVYIEPATPTEDLFWINNRCYVTEVTFRGHEAPAAAVAFNPDGSAGMITASPYIYNCSSVTTTGTGLFIDGSKVTGNKSMVSGQYTQVNQGGIGVHIINRGYAQLVGIYTIACEVGVLCESGGFCSLIGSDTSFGNEGLKAVGTSELLYSGVASDVDGINRLITVTGCTEQPRINNVLSADDGVSFYTVGSFTPQGAGEYVIEVLEPIKTDITLTAPVKFYQRSLITASGHTFEYAGSGTTLATALPQMGGVPDQTKEVIMADGGMVFYTSTDQRGDFRIGSDLTINRSSGTIEGAAFDKSLFAVMTPYILAIEG